MISMLKWLLLGYLVFWAVAMHLARRWMFFPQKIPTPTIPKPIALTTADGGTVIAQYYEVSNPKAVLLYSHGNAEELATLPTVMETYQSHGYAVFTYDYRGYGDSSGKPSEAQMYEDIRVAYRYLCDKLRVPQDQIILYGRSIGSGPSIDLATEIDARGLVLEGAFTGIIQTVTQWPLLPTDYFPNRRKIGHIRMPLLVIHGRGDHVVPFHHGQTLYRLAPKPKHHLWLDEAGHNDILPIAGNRYWDALDALIKINIL